MSILPKTDLAAILAAADAAGSYRVLARLSWLRANLVPEAMPFPVDRIRHDSQVALMRCTPGPCVELWAVLDWTIAADWQVTT